MTAGLCAGFTLAFVLFTKFFPIISIWETEEDLGKRLRDK
jgi:hypothetical protein